MFAHCLCSFPFLLIKHSWFRFLNIYLPYHSACILNDLMHICLLVCVVNYWLKMNSFFVSNKISQFQLLIYCDFEFNKGVKLSANKHTLFLFKYLTVSLTIHNVKTLINIFSFLFLISWLFSVSLLKNIGIYQLWIQLYLLNIFWDTCI